MSRDWIRDRNRGIRSGTLRTQTPPLDTSWLPDLEIDASDPTSWERALRAVEADGKEKKPEAPTPDPGAEITYDAPVRWMSHEEFMRKFNNR